jgi:dihydroxyacetone kinase
MKASDLKNAFACISEAITEKKDYLTELDQQNGDGDLGVSMENGFRAVSEYLKTAEETDLGKLMMRSSSVFNETSPSSLGTICAIIMMGMARSLKGKEEADVAEIAQAMHKGLENVMEKSGSKRGEKTVLDSLFPAVDALGEHAGEDAVAAFTQAASAAKDGAESTRGMVAVHGRAAYFKERSIGIIDGGAVVGELIFAALLRFVSSKA